MKKISSYQKLKLRAEKAEAEVRELVYYPTSDKSKAIHKRFYDLSPPFKENDHYTCNLSSGLM